MRSTTLLEYPNSLSYQETSLTKFGLRLMDAPASKIEDVGENSLEWSLSSGLDDLLDVIKGSWLLKTSSEINDGDVWGWDTEGHSGELSVEFWDDLSDSLGGSSRGWDDVLSSSTSVSPELSGWSVNSLLGGSDSVDSGHKSLNDSEVIIDNLGEWGKAIGGARSVGDDVVIGMIVLLVVDSDNEHWSVSRWSRDDDLKFTVLFFDDSLYSLPSWLLPSSTSKPCFEYLDLVLGLSVLGDKKVISLVGNGSLESSVGGVVLEQVDHVVDGDEWIVDGNNADAVLLDSGAEDETSDSSESVDSDTWLGHDSREQFPCNDGLGGDVRDEVDDSVGVSELVVVPGDELDEVWIEDDGCSGIEDGRVSIRNEVGGDDLVLGVSKNSLEWSLSGGLDDLLDVIERSWLLKTSSEINDGDVWGWDTEGHSGELSVEFWDDLSDSLGGSSRGWDDVLSSSTSVSPELSGWSVNSFLGGGDSVDSGHKSLNDSEVIIDNLGEWGKAVSGAGSVGDDVVIGMIVLLVVDSDDEHWGVIVLYLDLVLGLSFLGDKEVVSFVGNGSLEASVSGVILEQVDHVVDGDEWIVDGNNADAVLLDSGTEDETSDSSESVDSDTWLGHG